MEYLFLFIVIFIASIIHASIGFGYGIFAMSLLPLILPLKSASLIVLILGEIMCGKIVYSLREHVKMKFVIPLSLAAFVGSSLGVYCLMSLKSDVLKVILGAVLIVLSIYFYFFKNKIHIKPSKKNGAIAGFLSGALDGMLNMGGPPMVLYYYCALDDSLAYNASLQASFVINGTWMLIMHMLYGNFNMTVLKFAASGLVATLAGGAIGLYIFRRIKRETLSKAIYLFMIIMGFTFIFKR